MKNSTPVSELLLLCARDLFPIEIVRAVIASSGGGLGIDKSLSLEELRRQTERNNKKNRLLSSIRIAINAD